MLEQFEPRHVGVYSNFPNQFSPFFLKAIFSLNFRRKSKHPSRSPRFSRKRLVHFTISPPQVPCWPALRVLLLNFWKGNSHPVALLWILGLTFWNSNLIFSPRLCRFLWARKNSFFSKSNPIKLVSPLTLSLSSHIFLKYLCTPFFHCQIFLCDANCFRSEIMACNIEYWSNIAQIILECREWTSVKVWNVTPVCLFSYYPM